MGIDGLEGLVADVTLLGDPAFLGALVVVVAGYLFLRGSEGVAALLLVAGTAAGSAVGGAAAVFLTLGGLLARREPTPALQVYVLGWAVVLTLVVGTARLHVQSHTVAEVAQGTLLGLAWAVLWWRVARAVDPSPRQPQGEAGASRH